MTHLKSILEQLILRNDCVVIPSLGGFVGNYISAKVDVKNGIITPPSKALSFNKNLNSNDGLIVQHLSKEKNIPFEEARNIIRTEIQQVKTELNEGKRVCFHNVGFLYINDSGKIEFEQERFFNLLLSSYGLKNVHFVPEENKTILTQETSFEKTTIKTEPVATKNRVEEDSKIIHHPATTHFINKSMKTLLKYTAVAILIPLLFYSFWIPMKTDVLKSGIIYLEDFNPFREIESPKYDLTSEKTQLKIDSNQFSGKLSSILASISSSTPFFTYPLNEDLFIPVRNEIDNLKTLEVSETKAENISQHKYHAIVGCFSSDANAKKLISILKTKGFDAYQVDVRNGLHRISAGNTSQFSKIKDVQQSISEAGFSSWILKNN